MTDETYPILGIQLYDGILEESLQARQEIALGGATRFCNQENTGTSHYIFERRITKRLQRAKDKQIFAVQNRLLFIMS